MEICTLTIQSVNKSFHVTNPANVLLMQPTSKQTLNGTCVLEQQERDVVKHLLKLQGQCSFSIMCLWIMHTVVASPFLAIFKPEGKKHADIPSTGQQKTGLPRMACTTPTSLLKWGIKEWWKDIVNIQRSFSLEKTKEHDSNKALKAGQTLWLYPKFISFHFCSDSH